MRALAAFALGIAALVGEFRADAHAAIEPPPDARWQYQLQAIAKGGFESGRVDVGICGRAPGANRGCLRPEVIEFDLYRDGRGGAVDSHPNRRGVRAVHRAGGYAVCYVDAGGIETTRPIGARFKRWHREHGRSRSAGRSRNAFRRSAGPTSAASASAPSC